MYPIRANMFPAEHETGIRSILATRFNTLSHVFVRSWVGEVKELFDPNKLI